MKLAERTWTDVEADDADVAVLPVGSTEQHGPHAPLGTDFFLAETIADRAVSRTAQNAVVLPPLPFGIAEEHRAFAGTLWLSPSTFRTIIHELITSLAHHGIDHVVIVNGHGGNTTALDEICARITRDDLATVIPFTWFNAIDFEGQTMGHAGPIETAALLAVYPSLVHDDRLEDAAANASERWGTWIAGTNVAYDSDQFSKNGVVGDPREATQELGDELIASATQSLVTVIDAIVDES